MLNLHSLKVFVTAAETGGIRPAAERLGRTPSAVSMSLKQLEEDLGAPLFIGERKNALSELGELVLSQAREILLHFDGATMTMRAFARNRIGRSRVASVTSVSLAFLPAAIKQMNDSFPGFGVDLRQFESHHAHKAVLDGVVDMAFASYLNPNDEILFEPLFRDEIDIICRTGDPLERIGGPLPWSVLEERTFIRNDSFQSIPSPELSQISTGASVRAASVTNLLELVRIGVGVSVLPRLCRYRVEGVSFLPVQDPASFRIVGLMTKRGRPQLPVTRKLAEAARSVIRRRAAELQYTLLPEDALP